FGVGVFANESIPVVLTAESSNLEAAEIAEWNWQEDRDFGTQGTIKWNVQIKNRSSRNIATVRVEFTTYDRSSKLVATTFTYVKAIPAGGMRAEASYADLYGTEDTASVRITSVRFAD